jgi:hypothetical protein
MDVITCGSPEVAYFLGSDVADSVGWAGERGSRELKNGQRRSIAGERLCNPGDRRNEGW